MINTFDMMTEAEFANWQKYQPVNFVLNDGIPVLLPEVDQAFARISRLKKIANQVFRSEKIADQWLEKPNVIFELLSPKDFSAKSECNCQIVLRTLVSDRHIEIRNKTQINV